MLIPSSCPCRGKSLLEKSGSGPTFNLSDILFVQGTFGFVAAQCTAPKSDPLGMTFNISCRDASRTSRDVMSVLE